ncbi:MAG: acetyl-CoA carboxylase biotin carboxyl carrier protein subunit [Acidobacteria bacterium]|nr:acetyl-CoA carboxylase biotin carboxyl carrier protein subunit [Acidobacteriota bacterium]
MKRVRVDGELVPVEAAEHSVEQVEPGVYSILVHGRSYEARLDGVGRVWVGRRAYAVAVEDPRELSANANGACAASRRELVASMPGKVIRVLVAEGDEVQAGQGIVVVEAMKMQNEIPAPRAGRVSALRAEAGQAVAAGQVLAVIE